MNELVLSCFPGVLFQAHLFWRCYPSMDHRMVIWAQHPNIISLSVLCSLWSAVSMFLVVKVNDTRFSANCAASWNIWVAKKVAICLIASCRIIQPSGFGPCRWISFMEFLPASFHSLSGAFVRAVFSFPVVPIYSWVWLFADQAKSFFVWWLSVFANVETFLSANPLALNRAVNRGVCSWLERLFTLCARLFRIVSPAWLSLVKSIVVAAEKFIPVMRSNGRTPDWKSASAVALWWVFNIHTPHHRTLGD